MAVVNMCTTCFKIKNLKVFAHSVSYDWYNERPLFPKPSFCFVLFLRWNLPLSFFN